MEVLAKVETPKRGVVRVCIWGANLFIQTREAGKSSFRVVYRTRDVREAFSQFRAIAASEILTVENDCHDRVRVANTEVRQ